MPAPEPADLGPLAALVGTWEGDQGIDVSFHHADDTVGETRYRERTTFSPFGPVENGEQVLFGLDYRTAAWRAGEEDPFHTEVGYWLWDAAAGQVMRCFMVPRGSTVLAGGAADADATTFTMRAELGSSTYGILSNEYLDANARAIEYEVTVTIGAHGTYAYDEATTVELTSLGGKAMAHTDRNVLRRVA